MSNVSSHPADRPPNVVFIIADDLNDYGFYNRYPGVKMPCMDDFKKDAITFQHAYCASPVCTPSRAAVFSGLAPHATGAYLNGCDPWRQEPLRNTESMPERFKKHGYKMFGRGKLYHAPLDDGREEEIWDNRPLYGGGFGPFPPEEDQILGKFWGVTEWTGPDRDFPDVLNVEATRDFLQQDHENPFFLALGLWRPHTPLTAPKRFFDIYDPHSISYPPPGYKEGDLDDVPDFGRKLSNVWGERWTETGKDHPDLWRRIILGYFACTSFFDWCFGQVIEALGKSQYADNTIVVFWSDNGYHLGEKDHFEKATLWEQSALTPMAIRLPDRANGGVLCSRPVNSIDLFPTLVDLCNLEPPEQSLAGTNLSPLLSDPDLAWDRPSITTYGEKVFSARTERFRYIQYPDGEEELYDHDGDPCEFSNLADDPGFEGVKDEFKKWIPSSWAPCLGGRLG